MHLSDHFDAHPANTSAKSTEQEQQLAKTNSEQVQALLLQVRKAESALKSVTDHLSKGSEISTGYETNIESLLKDIQSLEGRIENSLPGATSTGLASTFNKQKSRFQPQQTQWLWIFIACMALLLIAALPSFLAALGITFWGHSADPSRAGTLRSLTLRLPILAPLV